VILSAHFLFCSCSGYVASVRKLDINKTWPFPQHLLETRLKEAGNHALPPLEIPKDRCWDCKSCLRDIMRDTQVSVQEYNSDIDDGCEILGIPFSSSSADLQEKQKQNMIDHSTEIVETLKFDMKSGEAVGSVAYEMDKEEKAEEVFTGIIMTEHGRSETAVPMELGIPTDRWGNCKSVLRDIRTSAAADSPIEEEFMRDTQVSVQDYNSDNYDGCEILGMRCSPSSADLKEKQKQNTIDHSTEIVETLKFDIRSGEAVGSVADEIDKEEKDEEVVTGIIMTEHGRTESAVPMELEMDKSEIADSEEKKSGTMITRKSKISESRSKRRPQKMRSISDIIASQPCHPESRNKQTEQSKSADIMEENMYRT
jgi:uncharacterized protein YoaH (UPF0181 family)